MDHALNACVCGGVEIVGIHTSAAPRNKHINRPVLEKHVFMSYQREVSMEHHEQEYINQCLKCIRTGLEIWLKNGLNICAKWRDTLGDCLKAMKLPANTGSDDVNLASEERQSLLRFLQAAFSVEPHDDDFMSNLSRTVDSYSGKLTKDALLGSLQTTERIKPLVDLHIYDLPSDEALRIVELGRGAMAKHLVSLIGTKWNRNVDYCIVTSSIEESQTTQTPGKHIAWDRKSEEKMPTQLKSANLVVVHQTVLDKSLCQTLEVISELENENLLLLVHGATANHELMVVVDALEKKLSPASDVAGDAFGAERVVQECARHQFELSAQVSNPLFQSLFLFKRKRETQPNTSRCQHKITVTSADFDWLPAAQAAMRNSEDLWLIARDPSDASGLVGLTKTLRLEPGGKNVRLDNTLN